jgi:dihydrodipicolinate synthase/N-acetylneuraminate lyase
VKFAASLLVKAGDEVRLPLVPATAPARERVRAGMRHAGLIN